VDWALFLTHLCITIATALLASQPLRTNQDTDKWTHCSSYTTIRPSCIQATHKFHMSQRGFGYTSGAPCYYVSRETAEWTEEKQHPLSEVASVPVFGRWDTGSAIATNHEFHILRGAALLYSESISKLHTCWNKKKLTERDPASEDCFCYVQFLLFVMLQGVVCQSVKWMDWVWFLARILLFATTFRPPLVPLRCLCDSYLRALSLKVRLTERKAVHSSSFSAEVKIAWSSSSLFPNTP
jgi:hypothetical protein